MNKFMGGLTLGIIITAGFFIYFQPFQKKIPISEVIVETPGTDSLPLPVQPPKDSVTSAIDLKANKFKRDSLVSFSKTLLGIPYLYGSIDPAKGFDCSGFITFVFSHFNIPVPRSSYEFAKIGIKRTLSTCQPGDLVLFTGTNPEEKTVGHIGIICGTVDGQPSFIHSTSGKANGVTITRIDNKFYQDRFMGITDLLSSAN